MLTRTAFKPGAAPDVAWATGRFGAVTATAARIMRQAPIRVAALGEERANIGVPPLVDGLRWQPDRSSARHLPFSARATDRRRAVGRREVSGQTGGRDAS